MKRFLVCDEIGNAVYIDAALESDRASMMCLPFATAQAILQEAFGQRFSTVRYADGTLFVFTQTGTGQSDEDFLFFMVSSDEGDSVPFLRRQLQLLSELILFKYGPHVNVRHVVCPRTPASHRLRSVWLAGASRNVPSAAGAQAFGVNYDGAGEHAAKLPGPVD